MKRQQSLYLGPDATFQYPQHVQGQHLTVRQKVAHAIESRPVHIAILALIILDFAVVMTEISIELLHEGSCKSNSHCHNESELGPNWALAEEVLRWITVAILSIFILEHMLILWAHGLAYYRAHWIHLFDFAVVAVSFALTLSLHGKAAELAGMLILLRLWRVLRVMDAVVVTLSDEHSKEVHKLQQQVAQLQQRCEQLELDLHAPLQGDQSSALP
jgi:hypothetical protein